MALQYGTLTQFEGMSDAIYLKMDDLLSPLFGEDEKSRESLEEAREGWKKLSFAIAKGVIDHITELAETTSEESTDDIFWNWIAQVNTWLWTLASWQSGFVDAFKKWESTDPADQDLRNTLIAVEGPGEPPAQAPTSLKGEIE